MNNPPRTPPPSFAAQPYNPPHPPYICVVHVDEDVLVLSKPSGLLSVPGKPIELADCLESRAKAAFPQALLTHRLDRDTSGLMLMAMNPRAQVILGKHFERRLIKKTYIATVHGHVRGESGTINLPMRADWPNRPMQKICHSFGREAVTDWRVLERGQNESGMAWTRMELSPRTGRSHQLRVHMRELDKDVTGGHPILGDALYAPPEVLAAAPRLMLHAAALEFHHPRDGQLVRFGDGEKFIA